MEEKLKVLIVGAGKGGATLVEMFSHEIKVELVGAIDINPEAEGIKIAREKHIPTYFDLNEGIEKAGADVIINVTGDEALTRLLMDKLRGHVACIGGKSAMFLWSLLKEKEKNLDDLKQLYQIGVQLSSFTNTDSLFTFLISKTKELTGTDAASIAIFDEKRSRLRMVATDGFSRDFMKKSSSWSTRVKGLTTRILNSDEPVVIEDTEDNPLIISPLIKKEGVRALMAASIRSENRIIGISYVDSFTPKKFLLKEISAFKLLSTQAAVAIEKTNVIEKTRELAYRDELTGLNNYRYFKESIKSEINRSKRQNHNLSLLLLDIDRFKSYNDQFGHQAGNYILEKLGAIMKSSFRETDVIARYGGEEFVAIQVETDKESAFKRAEKFRKDFRNTLRPEKNSKVYRNVTVSIGVAGYPQDSENVQGLIEKADEALYKAKKQGRDKVVMV